MTKTNAIETEWTDAEIEAAALAEEDAWFDREAAKDAEEANEAYWAAVDAEREWKDTYGDLTPEDVAKIQADLDAVMATPIPKSDWSEEDSRFLVRYSLFGVEEG